MYSPCEPVLHPVAIADRHPMQITVGLRDVDAKRKEWRAKADQEGDKYLSKHTIRLSWALEADATSSTIIISPERCTRRASRAYSSLSSLTRNDLIWIHSGSYSITGVGCIPTCSDAQSRPVSGAR